MFKLIIEKPAGEDIKRMLDQGGEAKVHAARILSFLQLLKGRQDWLEELLTRKFQNDEFNVDKYLQCWDDGLDMWRLALIEYSFDRQRQWQMPYRILYAYDLQCSTFRVLGVVHRSFDYQEDHEFTQRIRRTYDQLGLPKHKVWGPTGGRHKRH